MMMYPSDSDFRWIKSIHIGHFLWPFDSICLRVFVRFFVQDFICMFYMRTTIKTKNQQTIRLALPVRTKSLPLAV